MNERTSELINRGPLSMVSGLAHLARKSVIYTVGSRAQPKL